MQKTQPPAVLVTGAAGFIGFHVAQILLQAGMHVIGLDNLNDYYDPALKLARLDLLRAERVLEPDVGALRVGSSAPSREAEAERVERCAQLRPGVDATPFTAQIKS